MIQLTQAELAVASLIAEGKTNPEIALIRGVAPQTVKNQVSAVLEKCEVRNRVELVLKLLAEKRGAA